MVRGPNPITCKTAPTTAWTPASWLLHVLIVVAAVAVGVRRRSLTTWILVALVVGIVAGHDFPQQSASLAIVGTIFIRLIRTVIAPLLFATLVVGIAGHGNLRQVGRMGVKALGRRPETGRESMVGTIGIARTPLQPSGQLAIRGELWDAISDRPIEPGGAAQVLRVEGLTLYGTPLLQKKEA